MMVVIGPAFSGTGEQPQRGLFKIRDYVDNAAPHYTLVNMEPAPRSCSIVINCVLKLHLDLLLKLTKNSLETLDRPQVALLTLMAVWKEQEQQGKITI